MNFAGILIIEDRVLFHIFAEKPVLDNHIILTDVKTISGDEVTIPCGLIMGNPPGIMKWFKDGIEVKPDDLASIDEEGNLILDEVSSQNRGNYTCWASNVVGNSSRTYQIVVSGTLASMFENIIKSNDINRVFEIF